MKPPRQILQAAASEHFVWVDYTADDIPIDMSLEYPDANEAISLYAGLDGNQLANLENKLPAPLPRDIRDLLMHYSGFGLSLDVSFIDYNTWSHGHLLPHVMVLAADGCGNEWVIEVDPVSGQWKHVWYRCHDPCELMYQCETLSQFIEGVLDQSRLKKCQTGHRSILLCRSAPTKRLPTAGKLRASAMDDNLRSFVSSLHDKDTVVDLRNPKIGDGFNVFEIPSDQPVKRYNQELLFAYRKKPTFWQRLFHRGGK